MVVAGCASPTPSASIDPEEIALALVRGVTADAQILTDAALVAATATADFGIEEGLRRVVIRVVDEMEVEVVIVAEAEMVLAEPPGLCLVGPFWNPLDAGLSDRCWGSPDLGEVAAEQLSTEADGQVVLAAGVPVAVSAPIARGHERCDYAPGEWTLEVSLRPVVGEETFGPVRIPDVVVDVPFDAAEPVERLPIRDTRVCSYPAAVVNRQGEPELVGE